jgi:predicted HicB family RNase H-like nuclease
MTGKSQLLEARTTDKRQEVYRIAEQLYRQNTDWVSFYRDVLGLTGVIRQAFPTLEELIDFEQTDEYFAIQAMLAALRQNAMPAQEENEPTRVITVRLPKSMHEALRHEAHARHTSMNKLCISKLLQYIDDKLVPTDTKALDEDPSAKKVAEPVEVAANVA